MQPYSPFRFSRLKLRSRLQAQVLLWPQANNRSRRGLDSWRSLLRIGDDTIHSLYKFIRAAARTAPVWPTSAATLQLERPWLRLCLRLRQPMSWPIFARNYRPKSSWRNNNNSQFRARSQPSRNVRPAESISSGINRKRSKPRWPECCKFELGLRRQLTRLNWL